MKYDVGDKVALIEDVFVPEDIDKPVEITSVAPDYKFQYKSTSKENDSINLFFTENQIDHEKTAELNKLENFEDNYTKAIMNISGDAIEPTHYNSGEIDLIESWYLTMPFDGFRWAMKSHIHKYVYRYEQKNGVEDLDKAMEFIERLKEKEEEHGHR